MRLMLVLFSSLVALPSQAAPWDDFACPDGLTLKANTTRDGRHERWCETAEGQREGPFRAWYRNGQKWQEKGTKNGRQHGLSVLYMSNGQVSIKGSFDTGKKVGIWRRYWGNGQLKSEGRWSGYKPCGGFECFDRKGTPGPCGERLLFMHAGCEQSETGADCPNKCPFSIEGE